MLVLSKVMVDMVADIINETGWKVCLTASHFGTVGCVLQTTDKYGFTCEEDLFRVVVREAADELNRLGYDVDQAGIDEHEQPSVSGVSYSGYDLVIANHFDWIRGKKATYFTNSHRGNVVNNARNKQTKKLGIANAPAEYSEYEMTRTHNGIGVLIEWFSAGDQYDVNALLTQVGSATKPPVVEEKPNTNLPGAITKSWEESGSWISNQQYPVVAFSTLADAIEYDEAKATVNELVTWGELIAEYDEVFQDDEFNYIHWMSDSGEHRYAPTSRIGGSNLIGWFE